MAEVQTTCPYCGDTLFIQVSDGGEAVKARCEKCSNTFSASAKPAPSSPQPSSSDKEKTALKLFEDGKRLTEEKQFSSAATKLRAASENQPENLDILMTLGKACSKSNQSYEALAAYRKVLEFDPENNEALFKAGALLIHQKRYKKGRELLHKLKSVDPKADHTRLMLAIADAQLSKKDSDNPKLGTRVPEDLTGSERFSALLKMIGNAPKSTWTYLLIWIAPPIIFGTVYSFSGQNPETLHFLLIAMLLYTVFLGVVIHELGHGAAAFLSGDDTAYKAGRLTLNPLNHVSFIGTFIAPVTAYMIAGVPFGWAKPVPFNPLKLYRQPRDQALVAGAGPGASFILSYLMFIAFLITATAHNAAYPDSLVRFTIYLVNPFEVGQGTFSAIWFVLLELLAIGAVVNLILGVFNLIPAPPLDGSWLLKAAAPPSWSIVIDRFRWVSLSAIVLFIYLGWIAYLFYPANLILAVYYFLSDAIL